VADQPAPDRDRRLADDGRDRIVDMRDRQLLAIPTCVRSSP
jgi:hypothetical protein